MSQYFYLDWLLNEKSDDEPTQMSDDLKELFSCQCCFDQIVAYQCEQM